MNRRSMIAGLAAIPGLLRPASAADVAAHRRRPSRQELWLRTELYFGTSKPNGDVSEEDFSGFVDREVTPLFRTVPPS